MKRIGITGEGRMGTNIFQYLTGYDFELTWIISNNASTEDLSKNFQKKFKRSFDNGLINKERFESLTEKTIISNDFADLKGCSLVIEAVSEIRSLKEAIFSLLSENTDDDCILATNSSSILPSELFTSEENRGRIIGMHFFYPVALKNIAEIIRTSYTSEKTLKEAQDFLRSIDKNYLVLDEDNAFLLNRIFLDVQNEAWQIVSSGLATIEQVDNFIKERLTPQGIFDFCDSVGNDIMVASVLNYTGNIPSRDRFTSFIIELNKLVSEGKLGKKSGHGFYNYSEAMTGTAKIDENQGKRLIKSFEDSVSTYSARSGIPEKIIIEFMSEYF